MNVNKVIVIISVAMIACLAGSVGYAAVQGPDGPIGCSPAGGCHDVQQACGTSAPGMTCFYPGHPEMCDCHYGG